MTRRRMPCWAAALAAAMASLGGCQAGGGPTPAQELAAAREQVRKLTETNAGLQAVIVDQQKQISTLQAIGGEKRLELIPQVARIDLGDYTAGVSQDGQNFDYAVKVYIQPVDQDGSVLKAAGEVRTQVFDLAAPASENLVAECNFDVKETSKHWFSGFLTYHYSFVCPWTKAPRHDELTVRVTFIDYLTGRTFSAQKVVKVKLPPTTQPAK